jgi:hypothetical protein
LIEFLERGEFELYDLASDLGEKTNLAAKEKARVNELSAMLQGWKADVGAQAMNPNPQFKGR